MKVEKSFGYGKKWAERGGARFKTEDAMWKYMVDNKGKHRHPFGHTTICVNAHGRRDGNDEDEDRKKAVRKTVRVIIEQNGGDGQAIKKKIDTDYDKGIVRWNDLRVGQWDSKEKRMILKGAAEPYQQAFEELMK